MPRIVDYPRVSLKTAYELAASVDLLGGKCSVQSVAESKNLKVSGSFNALVSATSKYGLIDSKSGQLSITPLYKNIKLSYSNEERIGFERQSFLSVGLFNKLYDMFKGKPLPIVMLSKFLIRELNVEENIATRVKNIFIEGLKQINLLDSDNNVRLIEDNKTSNDQPQFPEKEDQVSGQQAQSEQVYTPASENQNPNEFSFHIIGPGINTKITIAEEEDFDILNAVIKKVRKRFNSES
jgi:hypothetical protein